MRALQAYGVSLVVTFIVTGDLDAADGVFKRMLGYDVRGDHLGARHRLLMLSIERGHLLGSKELRGVLKQKINNESPDDTFAIWNYTRALDAYTRKGDCSKSRKLLKHATSPGHESEARLYVRECRWHWSAEATAWVSRVFNEYSLYKDPLMHGVSSELLEILTKGTNFLNIKEYPAALVEFSTIVGSLDRSIMNYGSAVFTSKPRAMQGCTNSHRQLRF